MSVPRIVRSKYKFNAGSRTNLIVIKPEKCKINEQKLFVKLGLLNIRSLTPKAVIVNEIITDNSFDARCLTETWLKTNDYFGLNESTPPNYCYKHEPCQTGRGGGVATIYSDILNVTQKTPECRVQHQINSNSLISEPPTCEAACGIIWITPDKISLQGFVKSWQVCSGQSTDFYLIF